MAVTVITEKNFEQEVLKADMPVLVDFWASWCGPCRSQSPIIDELAGEVKGVKFAKLNVDDNMNLAQKYGVMSIPTLMLFRNGEAVSTVVGLQPKESVKAMLGV